MPCQRFRSRKNDRSLETVVSIKRTSPQEPPPAGLPRPPLSPLY